MKNLLWKCFELVINYYQGFIMTWFVYRFLNPKSLKQAKTFLSIFSIIFGTTITLVVPNLGNRFSHKINDADTPKEYRNLVIS